MPHYKFINRDRTLVLRDDYVIAWSPRDNAPVDPQPGAAPHRAGFHDEAPRDELQMWRAAGSPTPEAFRGAASPANGDPDRFATMPMAYIPPRPTVAWSAAGDLTRIEEVLPKLRNDDLAGLREQVQRLAKIVHRLVGGTG